MLLAGAALTCAVLALAAQLSGVLLPLEADLVDVRMRIRATQDPPARVVIVANEDRSSFIDPLPRRGHSFLIKLLLEAGVRAVAYDLEFGEPSASKESAVIAALRPAKGRIVVPPSIVGDAYPPLSAEFLLRQWGIPAADPRVHTDADGVVRRLSRSVEGLTSFPVAVAEAATGRPVPRDRFDDDGFAWIDFAGPPDTIRHLALRDLVVERRGLETLKDAVVVLGTSDASVRPPYRTAVGGGRMSEPEVLANAIATAMSGLPLQDAPWLVGILESLLAASVLPLAGRWVRPRLLPLVTLGALAVLGAFAQLVFALGWVVPILAPALAIAVSLPAVVAVAYVALSGERQRVRDVFARFVPAGVVDDVLARTDGDLRLNGQRMEATILFCDLRGSTAFAEHAPAEQVFDTLNRYLEEMTEAVLAHGGALLSYQGDGLLAAFGAPIEQADHADRALAAAREMAGPGLDRFNQWVVEEGEHEPFDIGIGINSGVVLSGNVGSAVRLAYTAVGDPVNIAARLEAMTKDTPHRVLISETTRELLREGADGLEFVDTVPIRGRSATVKLWTFTIRG